MDFEAYYNETISIFEELQSGKVLKKLPDHLASRIVATLAKYGKQGESEEECNSLLKSYDTRFKCDENPPLVEMGDMIDEPWYTGLVEVKGLVKGTKTLKAEAFCYDNKMAIFQGTKKKLLKGQIIFGPITKVNVGERKNGNTCYVNQSYCTEVQIKFASAEESKKWFELYRATSQVIRSMSIRTDHRKRSEKSVSDSKQEAEAVLEVEDGDSDIYDALDDVMEPVTVSSDTTDSIKLSINSSIIDHGRDEFGRPIMTTLPRTTKAHPNTEQNDDHDGSEIPEDSGIWEDYKYEDVYQAEWDFVTPDELLDIYGGALEVKRGDVVLVTEKTNTDWWKCKSNTGREGYIASCYLSVAFQLEI